MRKLILYSVIILTFVFLSGMRGGGADQVDFPNIYIDASAGAGGVGSEADPYDEFSDINWTTGGDNSVFDAVAADEDVTINLKKGVTWREQMTVGASGNASYQVVIQSYGSGADPIINGADLVATWTEYAAWQTAWDPSLSNAQGAGARNYRNILPADTSSYSGTKIRVTSKGSAGGAHTLDGMSIGVMTTGDDFDSAPTRVTWETGNSSVAFNANESIVSDEITFAFDKAVRYGIHCYYAEREYSLYQISGAPGKYYNTPGSDDTLTQAVSYSAAADRAQGVDLLEVFASQANVWQAACTTEPTSVFFNGTIGTNQASIGACTSARDWYWNSNVLYVYSTSDPDTAYTSPGIEATIRLDCVHIDTKDYVTVDGLSLKYASYYAVSVIDSCDNIIIQNNVIQYCSRKGIKLQGDNAIITNCSILDNTISDIGDGGAGAEFGIHLNGVDADTESTGNIIEGNTISDTVKGAIYLRHADSNIIRYNKSSGTGESNFHVTRSDSNQIYYNIFDHDGDENNDYVFYINDASIGTEVYNNVIVNNGNDSGLYCSGDSTGTKFKNNIYTGSGRALVIVDGAQTNFESDYNCLHVSGVNIAYWRGSNYATLALYQSASSQDANSIDSDPFMADPANDDFTLQKTSPCIDAGIWVGLTRDYRGYQVPVFYNPGILIDPQRKIIPTITKQILLLERATSETIDIGAYEKQINYDN